MTGAIRAFWEDGRKVLLLALVAFAVILVVEPMVVVQALISEPKIGAHDVVWTILYLLSMLFAVAIIVMFGRDAERHEYIVAASLICLLVIFMPTYLHTMYRRTGSYVLNPYNTIPAIFMLFGGLLNYREYRREEKVLAGFAGRYDASFYPEDGAPTRLLSIWGGLRAIACESRERIAQAGGGFGELAAAAPAQPTLGRYADGLRRSVRGGDGRERRQRRREVASRVLRKCGAAISIIWTLLIRFLKWFFVDGSKFLIVPLFYLIFTTVISLYSLYLVSRALPFSPTPLQVISIVAHQLSSIFAVVIIIMFRKRSEKYWCIILSSIFHLFTFSLSLIIIRLTGEGNQTISYAKVILSAAILLGGLLNYIAYRRMARETLNYHFPELPSPPSTAPLVNLSQ